VIASHKAPKVKRPRKRTFPLFENPDAAQLEALGDPDELVRLAFPELTRCDHCGVLDIHTRRFEKNGEKRWLHEDCSLEFQPINDIYRPRKLGHTVPRPPYGRIVNLMLRGQSAEVESIRCCGSLYKCDCYYDGLVDSEPHKYRLESFKTVKLRVKR